MKNRAGLNNFLSQDRKTLYMVLSVLVLSIFTLTMAYAALSTTLNINGNAEVSAASWDVYLDNIKITEGSVDGINPSIRNSTIATFTTELKKPGDFFEFTIDVVNDGSIDAMIDSVTKTPELSDTQKKYLNYIIEYQNGEAITTKQLVAKKSYVRLLVKVEFRKDISASDLPQTTETLNLSFTVNYVQADTSGTSVPNNGKEAVNIVSGDLNTVGSEIAIGDEHFYIISNKNGKISMLAKYNLEVGNTCASSSSCAPIENPSGIQKSTMMGTPSSMGYPKNGLVSFSTSKYWGSTSNGTYIYNNNSNIYNYVENYKTYLESQGAVIEEARLIKLEEVEALGCNKSGYSCSNAPSWVYATSYWTGTAYNNSNIWIIRSHCVLGQSIYSDIDNLGVRPVIVIAA